jgi:hypothetical protein
MPSSRGQGKARLMREAERVIDALLDWSDDTPEPNLSQIEEVVLELRKRFSRVVAQ